MHTAYLGKLFKRRIFLHKLNEPINLNNNRNQWISKMSPMLVKFQFMIHLLPPKRARPNLEFNIQIHVSVSHLICIFDLLVGQFVCLCPIKVWTREGLKTVKVKPFSLSRYYKWSVQLKGTLEFLKKNEYYKKCMQSSIKSHSKGTPCIIILPTRN